MGSKLEMQSSFKNFAKLSLAKLIRVVLEYLKISGFVVSIPTLKNRAGRRERTQRRRYFSLRKQILTKSAAAAAAGAGPLLKQGNKVCSCL